VRSLECDHGQEFSFAFVLGVEAAGIRHRYIRSRRPQQNGKVERSHRIDQEEFWGRQHFQDFETAPGAVRDWEIASTDYSYFSVVRSLTARFPRAMLCSSSRLLAPQRGAGWL